jgi:hypothetical protein
VTTPKNRALKILFFGGLRWAESATIINQKGASPARGGVRRTHAEVWRIAEAVADQ